MATSPQALTLASGLYGPPRKQCPRCRRVLLLEAYRPDERAALGVSSWCRECAAVATREWRIRNRERIKAARKREPVELLCSECGGTFIGRPNRKTCSDECGRARKARLDTR